MGPVGIGRLGVLLLLLPWEQGRFGFRGGGERGQGAGVARGPPGVSSGVGVFRVFEVAEGGAPG